MHERWKASYWPALDGLRGVAAALVLLLHAGVVPLRGGFIGVDIFFVLSGFLVTRILIVELDRTGSLRLWRFLKRRVVRLFPGLLVLLVVALVWGRYFGSQPVADWTVGAVPLAGMNLSNWQFAADGNETMGILAHTWSLGIEWQFYVAWALVLVWARKGGLKTSSLAVLVAAVIVGVAAWRVILWQPDLSAFPRIYAGFDTRLDAPLLGALVALLLHIGLAPRSQLQRWAASGAGLVGFLVLILVANKVGPTNPFNFAKGGFLLVAVATAILIYSLVTCPPPLVGKFMRWRPLVGLGKISYSLYLWHFPVAVLVPRSSVAEGSLAGRVVIECVLSLGLALLSYHLVERPALALMNHRGISWREVPNADVGTRSDEGLGDILQLPPRHVPTVPRAGASSAVGDTCA